MDILNCIKRDVHLATDIIQLGGIDYLSVAAQDYEQDDYLSDAIPHYIKSVLGKLHLSWCNVDFEFIFVEK